MSTLKSHKSGNLLEVKIERAFNLCTRNMVESRLTEEVDKLVIDFSACRFIDSEGVIFMFNWQNSGNKLSLINPPDILFTIINILEIGKNWDLNCEFK